MSHLIVTSLSKNYSENWVLCKSHVLCWRVPIASFPSVCSLIAVDWGVVTWFKAAPGNVSTQGPFIIPRCVKFLWDSKRPLPALTARFLISSSLTSGVSPADQSWKPTGLPGHHQRGGSGWDLRHHRALRPVQVRHPHPEDRQQLQGLHVRCLASPTSYIWQQGANKCK